MTLSGAEASDKWREPFLQREEQRTRLLKGHCQPLPSRTFSHKSWRRKEERCRGSSGSAGKRTGDGKLRTWKQEDGKALGRKEGDEIEHERAQEDTLSKTGGLGACPQRAAWQSHCAPDIMKNSKNETGRLPITGRFASFASCPNSPYLREVLSPRSVWPTDGKLAQSCSGRLVEGEPPAVC